MPTLCWVVLGKDWARLERPLGTSWGVLVGQPRGEFNLGKFKEVKRWGQGMCLGKGGLMEREGGSLGGTRVLGGHALFLWGWKKSKGGPQKGFPHLKEDLLQGLSQNKNFPPLKKKRAGAS